MKALLKEDLQFENHIVIYNVKISYFGFVPSVAPKPVDKPEGKLTHRLVDLQM